MTNLITQVSAVYAAAVLQFMLNEANDWSQKLDLPGPRPIVAADLTELAIANPMFGINAHLRTRNCDFAFPVIRYVSPVTRKITNQVDGRLCYFSRIYSDPEKQSKNYKDYLTDLTLIPSLIDTNGAYELAKQWLYAISIDVQALTRDHAPVVTQRWIYQQSFGIDEKPPDSAKKLPLPIFYIKWGNSPNPIDPEMDNPVVEMEIYGPRKELMMLRINDPTYSLRPRFFIANGAELNSRSPQVPSIIRLPRLPNHLEVILKQTVPILLPTGVGTNELDAVTNSLRLQHRPQIKTIRPNKGAQKYPSVHFEH